MSDLPRKPSFSAVAPTAAAPICDCAMPVPSPARPTARPAPMAAQPPCVYWLSAAPFACARAVGMVTTSARMPRPRTSFEFMWGLSMMRILGCWNLGGRRGAGSADAAEGPVRLAAALVELRVDLLEV